MSRVLLQPKLYSLRLNLEQVQHVSDGLIENRRNIEERHIELYDSQVEDILDQFRGQGVEIYLPEENEIPEHEQLEEVRQFLALTRETLELAQEVYGALNIHQNRHQMDQVHLIEENLHKIRKLVVGDEFDGV